MVKSVDVNVNIRAKPEFWKEGMKKDRNRDKRRNVAAKVINSLRWLLWNHTFGRVLHARCTHFNGQRKIRLQHKYGAHLQQLNPTERPPWFLLCRSNKWDSVAS